MIKNVKKCVVCDAEPLRFRWTDYAGEGECVECGCPYQIKWGSEEETKEGAYPYCNLKEDFIPIAREHWEETKRRVPFGMYLRALSKEEQAARTLFIAWIDERHPGYRLESKEGGQDAS